MDSEEIDFRQATIILLTALGAIYGGTIITLMPIVVEASFSQKENSDLKELGLLVVASGAAFLSVCVLFAVEVSKPKIAFDRYSFEWSLVGYGVGFLLSMILLGNHFLEQVAKIEWEFLGNSDTLPELIGNRTLYDWMLVLSFSAPPAIIFAVRALFVTVSARFDKAVGRSK